MTWQAISVSAVGEKHIKAEEPCQDCASFAMLSDDQVLVGAVSDGMGSATHSELGSQITVKVVISQLTQIDWLSQPQDERSINRIFRSTLEGVKAALNHEAQAHGYLVHDLSCTLIAFIATPTWTFAMQVGDGLLVARSSEGQYELLFKPDKGEFANETTSVTSSEVLSEVQTCIRSTSYKFICAATDGVENLSLVKSENWKPFEKFFEPLEHHMSSEKSLDLKERELNVFLNSNKINQSTDDDKTLLLCVFQNSVQIEKYLREQEDDSNAISKGFVEESTIYRSSEVLNSESARNVVLNRGSLIKQNINTLRVLILNELKEQGYQNVIPKFRVGTKLIQIDLLSSRPLVYRQSLGIAIYRSVRSLEEFKTRDIRLSNYFCTECYKRHWIKRLPGFLRLFL